MIILAALQYRLAEYVAREMLRLGKSECTIVTDPDRLRGLRGQEIYWVMGSRHQKNIKERETEELFHTMFRVMEMRVTEIILP